MKVEAAMTTDVVTCEVDTSLREATAEMLEHRVGSVIVTNDGQPAGIVTEMDAVHAGCVSDRPFSEIPVRKVASHPLVTVTPGVTVRSAVDRMREESVKKLPVVDGMDLVGVLTANDVIAEFDSLRKEIHANQEQRRLWSTGASRFDLEDSPNGLE